MQQAINHPHFSQIEDRKKQTRRGKRGDKKLQHKEDKSTQHTQGKRPPPSRLTFGAQGTRAGWWGRNEWRWTCKSKPNQTAAVGQKRIQNNKKRSGIFLEIRRDIKMLWFCVPVGGRRFRRSPRGRSIFFNYFFEFLSFVPGICCDCEVLLWQIERENYDGIP